MVLTSVRVGLVAAFTGSFFLTAAPAAQAATGTTVTPAVVHLSGRGFDAASAPSTAQVRAWTASPYRAVNVYFSGTQRFDTTQTQLGNDRTWTATVLSNGWSLIPTVVDLQAPCYTGHKKKMSSVASTAKSQAITVASQAHTDLVKYGLGGTIAYLDLENFDTSPGRNCSTVVKTFVAAYTHRLHQLGDKAGVYFNAHHGATTIAPMYGHADAPDDVWVANWNGVASAGDASIGTRWPHHRIHQYYSDGSNGNPLETYAGETINVDRDAIDGDVVAAKSVSISGYNVSAPGTGLKERAEPNTDLPEVSTLPDGSSLDIICQATGQAIDGDYVWDKLRDNRYVSDLYTTTTGRNWVSPSIAKCDTTGPTLSVTKLPAVTVGPAATIRWAAADQPDPAGTPPGETRGISGTTVRYRFATWHAGFSSWRTLTTTKATSATLPLTVGYAYCVQVQTRDLSGNPSAWSPQMCTVRPLDDRNLAASSGWARKTGSKYYKLTFTKTWAAGRTLSIANTRARVIGVLATTCSTCGIVKVYIGSYFVGRVNLQASGTHYKQLFMLEPFSIRSGTVKLVTKGSHLVQIDGAVISRV